MDIIEHAIQAISGKDKKVVFTECTDVRILQAARILYDRKICMPVLLGSPEEIVEASDKHQISLEGLSVYNKDNETKKQEVAERYCKIMPGISEKRACKKMAYPLNYAAMLVKTGYADCMASGVVSTTGDVILAAQQFIGVKAFVDTISSIGFQVIRSFDGSNEDKVIGVADCAVCADPNAQELADIAITSADSYAQVMTEPARVAMLSYSTFGSSTGPSVDLVVEAIKIAHEKRPDLMIDGECQIDTALSPEIAKRKAKAESDVMGKANVLIFPNLSAGNIAVKCMQLFGGKRSYGPLLQGFSEMVTDFSRAATVEDVVGNVVLCLMKGV